MGDAAPCQNGPHSVAKTRWKRPCLRTRVRGGEAPTPVCPDYCTGNTDPEFSSRSVQGSATDPGQTATARKNPNQSNEGGGGGQSMRSVRKRSVRNPMMSAHKTHEVRDGGEVGVQRSAILFFPWSSGNGPCCIREDTATRLTSCQLSPKNRSRAGEKGFFSEGLGNRRGY